MAVLATRADRFRYAVRWFRITVTLVGVATLAGFGVANMIASPATDLGRHVDMSPGPLDGLMRANRCSFEGFGHDVIPSNAIVRTSTGATELVSFDRGWAVFNGEMPGTTRRQCLVDHDAAVVTPPPPAR